MGVLKVIDISNFFKYFTLYQAKLLNFPINKNFFLNVNLDSILKLENE